MKKDSILQNQQKCDLKEYVVYFRIQNQSFSMQMYFNVSNVMEFETYFLLKDTFKRDSKPCL